MSFSRFERILEKDNEYQTELDEYDSDKYEKYIIYIITFFSKLFNTESLREKML